SMTQVCTGPISSMVNSASRIITNLIKGMIRRSRGQAVVWQNTGMERPPSCEGWDTLSQDLAENNFPKLGDFHKRPYQAGSL
ncbi:MAG TPA: hypothetical protein P5326_07630, partial [Candidatus Contendobacter sp.]|nr:hypothetical protein [Candidatus Contendobacter sp.]HRZ23892.1 hypothetical protein [Candidatus Contendobacter sp.]